MKRVAKHLHQERVFQSFSNARIIRLKRDAVLCFGKTRERLKIIIRQRLQPKLQLSQPILQFPRQKLG
jgi:hypothetical protein